MEKPLDKILLEELNAKGFTHLVAEDQLDRDQYTFKPVKWDDATFEANCESSEFDCHMVLSIENALKGEIPAEFAHSVEI